MLVSQLFNPAPIISLKLRTVPTFTNEGDTDEVLIVYADKRAVCIDGASLWVCMRLANAQRNELLQTEQPSLTYKKWAFQSQTEISDLVSCGPASAMPLVPSSFNAVTVTMSKTSYSARFIGVGRPMITFYATSDASRSFSLAGLMANRVTSAVTSAVYSFAKSFWHPTPTPTPPPSAYTDPNSPQTTTIAPPTTIPAILTLSDPHRHVTQIHLCPPSRVTGKSPLAVLADSLGRVMVLDVEEGEVIRMWKGWRGAQVGWIEREVEVGKSKPPPELETTQDAGSAPKKKRRTKLYLVLYAARGVLEVYGMRRGERVAAFNAGVGYRLVQTCSGVVGGAYMPKEARDGWLSQCYLVGGGGEVKRVVVSV
ncbi:Rab3 GTPase-activating protein non-catalytic subunit [Rhizophlyctis rosea]|uniref:Rab3 GTPase-activating protein non-catalytic subunit n=1 Tax=Rhizophlyctis rosea TaxID=64517 RepID=A0AAD5S8F7_9FUNG|nr:Rab3 GTPase-activating protein non-catalytic subunit [Rhizophlyctis rosea]